MESFYYTFFIFYTSTPTGGAWFQINQPQHKSQDPTGDTVTSECVTKEKETALQWQI